jgi:hypothetical protein
MKETKQSEQSQKAALQLTNSIINMAILPKNVCKGTDSADT